ncbi:hypothetical protein E2C01_095305 [Portunus trituberculatus]|uniref:Uncharacterized protein n=1 Tax=Portunus trituberculatus TaxID=210409 RepID=A0A5B7JUX2_PORTR|nr:hypothetical protein [Portunus trituberculatus]
MKQQGRKWMKEFLSTVREEENTDKKKEQKGEEKEGLEQEEQEKRSFRLRNKNKTSRGARPCASQSGQVRKTTATAAAAADTQDRPDQTRPMQEINMFVTPELAMNFSLSNNNQLHNCLTLLNFVLSTGDRVPWISNGLTRAYRQNEQRMSAVRFNL